MYGRLETYVLEQEIYIKKYILQSELYEYDKKHNILSSLYIFPEQNTTGLAKKLGIKKH